MRGERTETAFAHTKWEDVKPKDLPAQDLSGFYQHMSDMGLRYGEEFRGVKELAAAGGVSHGKVALTEESAKRAGEYQLHPVLMDAALHVFSAGAKTVESRKAKLKLPVRFQRILFLRSPGASSQVRASVTGFNDDYLEGELGLYDEAGQPCVLVDGFRAIAVAGARRSGTPGGQRDLVYQVAWERTNPSSAEPSTSGARFRWYSFRRPQAPRLTRSSKHVARRSLKKHSLLVTNSPPRTSPVVSRAWV